MNHVDFNLVEQQCVNQHATTARDFMGMTAAYMNALFMLDLMRHKQEYHVTTNWLLRTILTWGYMVDDRNVNGWRHVPVQVGSDIKLQPELIDRQMNNLVESMITGTGIQLSSTEVYRQFEDIHPFIDGNGRVGHVLWAWYTAYLSGQWPQTLPPDVFNQGIEGAAAQ